MRAASCGGTDCDDGDPSRFPGNAEICDPAGADEDCDATTFGFRDRDADAHADADCCNGTTCGDDCDDRRPDVHAGLAESCDGLDNDCDDSLDEGVLQTFYRDADGDMFGTSETTTACAPMTGYAIAEGDCDDENASIHPAALEICDGVDNDCDGAGDSACGCTTPGATRTCGGTDRGECRFGSETCVGGSWVSCDAVGPRGEACNGLDDDCDGTTDEGLLILRYGDADGDGSAGTAVDVCPADAAAYFASSTDCNDADVDVRPGQTAFFYDPTCPHGTCMDGSFPGCFDDGGSCRRLTDTGYPELWDYDCDGVAEVDPACGGFSRCGFDCPCH